MMMPTVTHASARLKVGQWSRVMKSGTCSAVAPDDPFAQVPDAHRPSTRPAAHGQRHGAHLGHDDGQHDDTDAEQHRHDDRPAAEEAEGETRVDR